MTTPTDTAGLREMLAGLAGIGRDGCWKADQRNPHPICRDAAQALPTILDEIDTLRARVEELEGGLRGISLLLPSYLRYSARTTLKGTEP